MDLRRRAARQRARRCGAAGVIRPYASHGVAAVGSTAAAASRSIAASRLARRPMECAGSVQQCVGDAAVAWPMAAISSICHGCRLAEAHQQLYVGGAGGAIRLFTLY
ncbi:hypothetical protein PVAP13_9NG507014 [Panicum virgatum]|uniref:Uncharacterized protein n=1 Tax=Panicum virgatum TaxID=38727 RepID=A0A8T0MRW1_PANVG|nr:hypothetical protein PVAP13_9NG507014 [Panicum virgatum]